MKGPKISVIIPVYNASKYLKECIESVLSQSFEDWELILVNDGSTDNSLDICQDYVGRYPETIRLFTGPNRGVSAARNTGLEAAEGEWITFADADDYFLPDAFKTLMEYAERYRTDIVLANALKLKDRYYSYMHRFLDGKIKNDPISAVSHCALWGYLFKGSIIKANDLRFVDGLAYSEDRVFIFSLAAKCSTLVYCEKAVYVYRMNSSSACASTNYVRKAQNQFRAARCMSEIIDSLPKECSKNRKRLCKERNYIIVMGITQISLSRHINPEYQEIKNLYKKSIGDGCENMFFFYRKFLSTSITNYRRRFITKDSVRSMMGLKKNGFISSENLIK